MGGEREELQPSNMILCALFRWTHACSELCGAVPPISTQPAFSHRFELPRQEQIEHQLEGKCRRAR